MLKPEKQYSRDQLKVRRRGVSKKGFFNALLLVTKIICSSHPEHYSIHYCKSKTPEKFYDF